MSLLVHCRQQVFYAQLLRRIQDWNFRIVAHGSKSCTSITEYLPQILGHHPYMDSLIGFGSRKYYLPPPDLRALTESRTGTDGMAYRYCVMNDETYCPILLCKLLVMQNIVVLQVSDPDTKAFYESCTIHDEDTVRDMDARQLRDLARTLNGAWKKLPHGISVVRPDEYSQRDQGLDQIPEDKWSEPQTALVTKDKEGKQHLSLTPTDGPDSLPHITILTHLSDADAVTKCQQMLLRRCWLDNRYPVNRIKWIIKGCGGKPEWWNWAGECVSFVDTGSPTTSDSEYVVIWSLDHYYFPHSTYAKVKLILDSASEVNCVGSNVLGEHCLENNKGYSLRLGPREGGFDASLCYRSFRQPISGTSMDWKGWISTYMDVPFSYNCIKINFKEDEGDPEHKLPVIKLLGDEMRSFMNKLYRQLRN
jgi:hypothetical protein